MDTSLPDPTDWLRTPLHPLSALDASLRCQVCKDFYTNPVITSCSHTFCSLCIRRCLSAEGKCPTCRADDQEVRLRQNWALGEVVESFQAARAEVLKFATEAERRKENESEESGIRTLKKRKLGEVEGEELEGSPRRTRSRSARQTENTDGTPVVIENSQDEEYEPGMFQWYNNSGLDLTI